MAELGAFGDALRRAREARGVAIETVAHATRIARHYLDAIERSDLRALPAGPFGKGYIRAYAEFLGIDPDPILEAYRATERDVRPHTTESDQKLLAELSRAADRRRGAARRSGLWLRAGVGLIAALLAGAALVGAWFWWSRERAPERVSARLPPPAPPEGKTEPASPAPPPVAPSDPPAAPEPEGARVSGSGVGTAVVDRMLVGRASEFPENTRVVYWTRILDGEAGDSIQHLWYREGQLAMRADLAVGGRHWRTHSAMTLPPGSAGAWRVEARTAEGRMLDWKEFACVARQP